MLNQRLPLCVCVVARIVVTCCLAMQACSTKRRVKDLDQIQDEIRKVEEEGPKPRPLDDSLPG